LYVLIFIVVPLAAMDITVGQFIIGFLLLHVAKGYTLALVFHPAHAVDTAAFPEPDEKGNIMEEWAAHQMRTTVNFATQSKLVTWFTGGLNMQVEHHLFPNICHIHYPKIKHIVKEAAQKFNLPYHEAPTFLRALYAHYKLLKHYGPDEIKRRKGLLSNTTGSI
jgi:linoleoyl-CoA desaturase